MPTMGTVILGNSSSFFSSLLRLGKLGKPSLLKALHPREDVIAFWIYYTHKFF